MLCMYSKCICIWYWYKYELCQVVGVLGRATCFKYSRSFFFIFFNILCDHDVIDTYLSLRYICYNYCGPVYIKLNFESLRVLWQCEPPGAFASGRNLVICHISVSWSLCNSRVKTMPKNRGNSQLKRIYYRKNSLEQEPWLEIPVPLWLLLIGSIFEFMNQRPLWGYDYFAWWSISISMNRKDENILPLFHN